MMLIDVIVVAKLLQFAGGRAHTGQTLAVVIGKQKLQVHLAEFDYLGGIGQDFHPFACRIYAGGDHTEGLTALGCLDQAKATGADFVDILQIAQCGNFHLCRSGGFKNCGTLGYLIRGAVNLYMNCFHLPQFSFL